MVTTAGLEPATSGVPDRCSLGPFQDSTELRGHHKKARPHKGLAFLISIEDTRGNLRAGIFDPVGAVLQV